MRVEFLKANNGDAILLTFADEGHRERHILIDGGMPQTYLYTEKKKKKAGPLQQLIEKFRETGKVFDLVILTHVDQDHVGGLVKWISNDPNAASLIKEVWFNSGLLIKEYFNAPESQPVGLSVRKILGPETSIAEGVTFEQFISANQIWNRRLFKRGDKVDFYGLQFQFLSPDHAQLEELLEKWHEEEPGSLDTAKVNDHGMLLRSLYELEEIQTDEQYKEDKAVHNGSSLAFILIWKNKKFLFLGDAFPSVLVEGLGDLNYSPERPISAELVKLSHHGSAANNSRKLLKMIDTNDFIISTNGKLHNHPNKRLISRLIHCHPNCNIYFNYPDLIGEIFGHQDIEDFPEVRALPLTEAFAY